MNSSLARFVVVWCGAAVFLGAQSGKPNLSGFWELGFDSRNVPTASPAPAAASADGAAQAKLTGDAVRWCHFFGVPYAMGQSPIDFCQNTNGKKMPL